MKAPTFTVGRLAKQAGVNVETVRYYQRRGLLDQPDKPLDGARRYPVTAVERIRFIKRAQALGFTLEEISVLLRLDEACACAETRELAVRKLAVIESKLADLTAMRDVLKELVHQCDEGAGQTPCPIIRSLAQN
ncbi:Hg(II)-responsive transcriptional regulator [Methylocaldum gracile]|jgi:MerR family mercuric resistance operon transcriptional regulator|uniref:Hg(II)-responsive transcriptional regulator n=1 Tax=unclassified Methylocaldum TaxID=2622260 RepID=UPI00105CC655